MSEINASIPIGKKNTFVSSYIRSRLISDFQITLLQMHRHSSKSAVGRSGARRGARPSVSPWPRGAPDVRSCADKCATRVKIWCPWARGAAGRRTTTTTAPSPAPRAPACRARLPTAPGAATTATKWNSKATSATASTGTAIVRSAAWQQTASG